MFAIFTGQFITEYIDADQPTAEELDGASEEEFKGTLKNPNQKNVRKNSDVF